MNKKMKQFPIKQCERPEQLTGTKKKVFAYIKQKTYVIAKKAAADCEMTKDNMQKILMDLWQNRLVNRMTSTEFAAQFNSPHARKAWKFQQDHKREFAQGSLYIYLMPLLAFEEPNTRAHAKETGKDLKHLKAEHINGDAIV